MSVQAQSRILTRKSLVIRVVVATLLSLVILSRILSTLGGVWEDVLRLAVTVLPWFLIVFGTRRRRIVGQIGWTLLIVLFVLAIFSA